MSESQEGYRARHQPSPEGFMVARTARSPGFGTSLAFPVSQWLSEWRPGRVGQVPVTVAGPRRICTGFRISPFVCLQLFLQRLVYWFRPPAAREVSNRALSRARSD
jgi:hypothetical protein